MRTSLLIAIIVCCSMGFLLSVIGLGAGNEWIHGEHGGLWREHDIEYAKREILERQRSAHEFQTTRAFSIFGAASALAAIVLGAIRMKFDTAAKSKSFRLAFVSALFSSFLSLLISVAVWGDFTSHGNNGANRMAPGFVSSAESQEGLHLGWAFWVTVAADVFLFAAFLLYLMRTDCQPKAKPQGDDQRRDVSPEDDAAFLNA